MVLYVSRLLTKRHDVWSTAQLHLTKKHPLRLEEIFCLSCKATVPTALFLFYFFLLFRDRFCLMCINLFKLLKK